MKLLTFSFQRSPLERSQDALRLNDKRIKIIDIKQSLQLLLNEAIEPLPELTLDIGKGLTPDISVFLKEQVKPNLFRDIIKFKEKPLLVIEVVSSSQTIQEMLDKASVFVNEGVNAVWTVEPHSRTVFVTTLFEEKLFHEAVVETEQVKVDFSKVYKA